MRNGLRPFNDESGIALITGLMLLASLTAIGVFVLNGTMVHQDISGNLKGSKQGFYLADAGFEHAWKFLMQNINKWNTYATLQTLIPATQLSDIGTYTVTIQDAGGGGRRVISTGTTSSKGKAVIEALFGNNPRYPCAFCSQADITIGGGGITDSFDSSQGTYAQTVSSHGDLRANTNIRLQGNNTTVKGNATAGPAPGYSVNVGQGTVTGTISNADPQYFPPVHVCGPPYKQDTSGISPAGVYSTSNGQLQSSGAAIVLAPGTYCFSSVQITGGGSLTVQGDPGCTSCAVHVYVTGDSSFSGQGIINTTLNPANLRIFSSFSSSSQGISLTGGSEAYAAVYAPNAYVKFSGGSDFYGSAVGNGVDDIGGTNIHYDLSLNALANAGLGFLTWRQVF